MNPRAPQRFSTRIVLALGGTLICLSSHVGAQSAQKYGAQASIFATGIQVNGGTLGGIGIEGQVRLNELKAIEFAGGPLSLGIGAQYTSHSSADDYTLKVSGVFLEPRIAIDKTSSERLFPYLSARFAALRQSSDFASSSSGAAVGVGGGIGYKLSPALNLDVGVAGVYQNFANAKTASGGEFRFGSLVSYVAKLGINVGFH